MRLNPELQRNLWLEWSTHRMVFVLVMLASIFVLVGLFDPRGLGNAVANVGLALFVVTAVIWGGHRAGDAMLDELREHTWDSQRMSALAPWTMTWGKLCGATVMPWFAGLICLAVYFVARHGPGPGERLKIVAICLAGALLAQALSLIAALVGTHLEKQARSTLTSWAAAGTLLAVAAYFSMYYRAGSVVNWYGLSYERFDFLAVSLVVLAVWAVLGAYRLMSMELAVATRPWAWLAFILYLTIYFAGGMINTSWPLSRILAVVSAVGLAVSVAATYIAAFALYRDPLVFRRLATYAYARRWRRFLEETPIWMTASAVAFVFTLLAAIAGIAPHYSAERVENVGFGGVVILLYTARNLGLLYFFTYGSGHRRVETATIICIAIISWLLPSILESAGLLHLSWLLRPPLWDRPLLSAAILLVHIIVVALLCTYRYRALVAPGWRQGAST